MTEFRVKDYFNRPNVQAEMQTWRQYLHQHPELSHEEEQTAAFVAENLRRFKVDDVITGIGGHGVVGVIKGQAGHSGRTIGLRADMDALPIKEDPAEKPWASKNEGVMHACGHDGHTSMLLGAAQYLAKTRDFDGTVHLIFQPAEEKGNGAELMINDSLFQRFECDSVHAVHNAPWIPFGKIALNSGTMLASVDDFTITITGKDGHVGMPHNANNPINAASALNMQLQQAVARINPVLAGLISVTYIGAGEGAHNVIPKQAEMRGSIRAENFEVRDQLKGFLENAVMSVREGCNIAIETEWLVGVKPTINNADEAAISADVAAMVVGAENVDRNMVKLMGGEDFSFMLDECPGSFVFLGQGTDHSVHTAQYDFRDGLLPIGSRYFVETVHRRLSPTP